MKLSCHGLHSSSIWAWVLSLRLGNIHFGHKLPIFSILSILRYLGEFDQKDLYRNCSQNLWLSQEYPKVQDGKHYFAICHSCELQDSAAANFIYCTLIFYFNFMFPFNAPRTHHPKHLMSAAFVAWLPSNYKICENKYFLSWLLQHEACFAWKWLQGL